MDRRTFLKTSTAAAAFPAGAAAATDRATPSDHAARVAPSSLNDATPLRLHIARPADPLLRDQAERLLTQITTATHGAITAVWRDTPSAQTVPARDALRTGALDAAFAIAPDFLDDPAVALFTGLPGPYGLTPENLLAWHTIHGADAHLEALAAAYGVKILLAGHTGQRPGLWANRDLTDLRDVAETRLTASGLGQRVWERIRAPFPADTTVLPSQAREFLADPAIALRDARAEGLTYFFRNGLHDGGIALTLILSTATWHRLTPPQRLAIEATAAAALHETIAAAAHHHQVVIPALARAGTIRPRQLPDLVLKAIDHVSSQIISNHIVGDPRLTTAWSAYQTFHHQQTGQPWPLSTPSAHTA